MIRGWSESSKIVQNVIFHVKVYSLTLKVLFHDFRISNAVSQRIPVAAKEFQDDFKHHTEEY